MIIFAIKIDNIGYKYLSTNTYYKFIVTDTCVW